MIKITIEKDEKKKELNFNWSDAEVKSIVEKHGVNMNNELLKFFAVEIIKTLRELTEE